MRHRLIFLFSILYAMFAYAQPGPFGTDMHLILKDKAGLAITPDRSDYDVKWVATGKSSNDFERLNKTDTLSYKTDLTEDARNNNHETISFTDLTHIVNVYKTPMGGGIHKGSHFLIVKEAADTMRLYPPLGYFDRKVVLDDIPFRQGDYEIDGMTYLFHSNIQKEKRRLVRPNMYSDWQSFRFDKTEPSYRVIYAECIDTISGDLNEVKEISRPELLPVNGSARWFYNDYVNNNTHHLLRALKADNYRCIKKENQPRNCHHFFALNSSGIYIYQKRANGPIEYGFLMIPVSVREWTKEDGEEDKRFTDQIETIPIHIWKIIGWHPDGYYEIAATSESTASGTPIRSNGVFRVHLNSLSPDELKQICDKHANEYDLYIW